LVLIFGAGTRQPGGHPTNSVTRDKKGDKDRAIADFNEAIRLNPHATP